MQSINFAKIFTSFLSFFVAVLPLQAQEQETKSPIPDSVGFNVFLSSGYSYNFNNPDGGKNQYRVFDFDDNSFKIDVVTLSLQKKVHDTNEIGFRADLSAGSSIPQIIHSNGLTSGDLDLQQAFISYCAPICNGITFDFGKFNTHLGYEVIEGIDDYNNNYSHSFLFGYAIPFTHTGIRATYSFTNSCTLALMGVNGWDDAIDNNKSKSLGAQITLKPSEELNLYVNYLMGPEKAGNNDDTRHIIEVVGKYQICDNLFIGINGDYGSEENSASGGENAVWQGIAGYFRYNVSSPLSFTLRCEVFDDNDGFRTGLQQTLKEVTLTTEIHPVNHFVMRGDLRIDGSNLNTFQNRSDFKNSQVTFGLNVLYWL